MGDYPETEVFHLRSGFAPIKFQVYLTWKKTTAEAKDVAVFETDIWQSPISKGTVDIVSYVKSCLGAAFQPTDNSVIFCCSFTTEEQIII